MHPPLKTYVHSRKLLTHFNGGLEAFSVRTRRITLCSEVHITEVFYDLSTFDPDDEKDFVIWKIQSASMTEALSNHIALVKLVLKKEEPINWSDALIDKYKPKQLLDSLKLPILKLKGFRSNYSKSALAICQMYPR